ncbi:MAG: hypothetical protein IT384_20925 [Deltaproteobacteria bacterium]|nr:hypothetical protein [Deltaproteobacteria bacterium]
MRLRHPEVWLALWIGGPSCTSGVDYLAPPLTADTQSFVVLFTEGGTLRAQAFDRDSRAHADIQGEAWLLQYRDTLETLGLREGLVTPSQSVSCRTYDPTQVHHLREDDGALAFVGGAVEIESEAAEILPSGALETLAIDGDRRCARCVSFEERRVRIASTVHGHGRSIAPLESGAVLAAYTTTTTFIVNTERAVPLLGCGELVDSIWPQGGDRFVFATSGFEFFLAEIDEASRRCTRVATYSFPEALQQPLEAFLWVAGSRPDEPYELFLLSDLGRLVRFDGQSFEVLAQVALNPHRLRPATSNGGLVRLGPGHVLANAGWKEVVEWRDGALRTEEIPVPATADPKASEVVTAIGFADSAGALAGGSSGELYRRSAGQWTNDRGTPIAGALDDVGTFLSAPEQRFFATVEAGRVFQHHPERGYCPHTFQVRGSSRQPGREVLIMGHRIAAADFIGDEDSESHVVWLTW